MDTEGIVFMSVFLIAVTFMASEIVRLCMLFRRELKGTLECNRRYWCMVVIFVVTLLVVFSRFVV